MSIYRKGCTHRGIDCEFFATEIANSANLRFIEHNFEHADMYTPLLSLSLSLSLSPPLFPSLFLSFSLLHLLKRSCLLLMMNLVASGASFVMQQRHFDVSLSRDDKHLDALKVAQLKADITDATQSCRRNYEHGDRRIPFRKIRRSVDREHR